MNSMDALRVTGVSHIDVALVFNTLPHDLGDLRSREHAVDSRLVDDSTVPLGAGRC